jgi:hypothetical protein
MTTDAFIKEKILFLKGKPVSYGFWRYVEIIEPFELVVNASSKMEIIRKRGHRIAAKCFIRINRGKQILATYRFY